VAVRGQAAAIRHGSATLLTECLVMEAHGHAALNDASACGTALARAEQTFDRAAREDDPAWLAYFAGRTHRDGHPTRGQTSSQDTLLNGYRNPVKRLATPLPGPDSRPLCVRGPRNTAPYSATR
jgi:hypothetical protein